MGVFVCRGGSPCRESKVMMGKLDTIAFIAITKDPESNQKNAAQVRNMCGPAHSAHTLTQTRAHTHTHSLSHALGHALAGAAPGGSRWRSVARRPRDLKLPSPAALPPPASGPQPAPGPRRAAALHLTEGEIMRSIRGAVTAPRQLLVHSNHCGGSQLPARHRCTASPSLFRTA